MGDFVTDLNGNLVDFNVVYTTQFFKRIISGKISRKDAAKKAPSRVAHLIDELSKFVPKYSPFDHVLQHRYGQSFFGKEHGDMDGDVCILHNANELFQHFLRNCKGIGIHSNLFTKNYSQFQDKLMTEISRMPLYINAKPVKMPEIYYSHLKMEPKPIDYEFCKEYIK